MLVDSHCHINFISFKDDADSIIKDFLRDNYALIVVGSQDSTSRRAIEYADSYERGVYAAVGLHPIDLIDEAQDTVIMDGKSYTFKNRQEDFDKDRYRQLVLSSAKVVAIGEVGLDYYYFDKFPSDKWPEFKLKQKEALIGFMELAQELDKPVIFHCRGTKDEAVTAYDDLLTIIKDYLANGGQVRGVVHCFGGNLQQAQAFTALGLYIGFTGILTFNKKSEELQAIAKSLPLEKILVETDAPFLSPEPYRGKRCLPQYVEFVAKKVADLKDLSYQIVAEATTDNAKKLFGI